MTPALGQLLGIIMFNKKSEKTQKHYHQRTDVIYMGVRLKDLPKLTSFIYLELSAQKDYPFGFKEADLCSKTCFGYHTRLYLPNNTLVLEFEFDCKAEQDFPKLKMETIKTEEYIDKTAITKKFLQGKKETHQYTKIETIEYVLSLGGLPLVDYLKAYEKDIDIIRQFLNLYQTSEKVFRRELNLGTNEEAYLSLS